MPQVEPPSCFSTFSNNGMFLLGIGLMGARPQLLAERRDRARVHGAVDAARGTRRHRRRGKSACERGRALARAQE